MPADNLPGPILASQWIRVCQLRVGQSLQRVNPGHHRYRRTRAHRLTNPVPYCSEEYFGEKLVTSIRKKNLSDVVWCHTCTCVCNRWVQ